MGYSSRYHAASLAAVFLALAIGILIGVGLGSDVVSGTAEDLERSLGSDLDEARAEADELEVALRREREFGAAIYPAVVRGELRDERIGLIGLGGVGDELVADVRAAVDPAGASLVEVAVVREPPDLDGLAATLGGRRSRSVSRGDAEELGRIARRAARSMLAGTPGFDRFRDTLLSRFSGRAQRLDGVVVARERPAELEPDEEAATELLEEGLLAGIRASGVPAVGVERSLAEESSIEFFDGAGLATVDNVDLQAGRVALVHALRGGIAGNYGVKESADSLLPELLSRR